MTNMNENKVEGYRVVLSTETDGVISVSDVLDMNRAIGLARIAREANDSDVRVEIEACFSDGSHGSFNGRTSR